ncbi:hypothetical protein Trydic_g1348 [Trypoxylus dichotomus]
MKSDVVFAKTASSHVSRVRHLNTSAYPSKDNEANVSAECVASKSRRRKGLRRERRRHGEGFTVAGRAGLFRRTTGTPSPVRDVVDLFSQVFSRSPQ